MITWSPNAKGYEQGAIQYYIRHLIRRSHKVWRSWDWVLKCLYRFEICQVPLKQWCWGTYQISEQLENSNHRSCTFETLWDLTIRRLMWYWITLSSRCLHLLTMTKSSLFSSQGDLFVLFKTVSSTLVIKCITYSQTCDQGPVFANYKVFSRILKQSRDLNLYYSYSTQYRICKYLLLRW